MGEFCAMTYKHILAAVDLSEEATQVLDKAGSLATLTGATVSIVSVVRPLTQVYGGLDIAPLSVGGISFEQEALQQATTQVRSLAARYGIPVERTHVFIGAPPHDVREVAARIGADLIVVGTHGRHGLGLLLGSTANAIIHGVGCDVLAVRMRFDA
jgi:universal stress protein A